MEQFKQELKQLLRKYPQVESVSYSVMETVSVKGESVTVTPSMYQGNDVFAMPPLGSKQNPNLSELLKSNPI